MRKTEVGKVIHYYDKIGVAIVRLSKSLTVGGKVKFEKGDYSFEQIIESMQLDHKPISEGKSKEEVAIKVDQAAKEGTIVSLV
ncbi:MAG: hypothetical protein A3J69_01000 [Candidatus Levybacteria bacterium RIFCSPHIGHO2_02_FULL_42_12]|nr:MAG: hypothetical protein A2698_01565 [Candidatus Levybacteria bacterium RIFCSPHIGHO2_01_FULL_42_15]OGH33855.1 MAG: hypothetical protein A3J69_01000 [Candidatus Levybacteria bacterium RIFCSPHIGHO2_02_FULL_42_12]